MPFTLPLNDVDRRIWDEELAEFVPRQVFDVHTHLYRWAFNLDPKKESGAYHSLLGQDYADATLEMANTIDDTLMPGREVHRLSFPFPFQQPCDFAGSNAFVAAETAKDPASRALMLVHPGMTAEEIERDIDRYGFLGLKPYRFYSSTDDAVDCRMTDFLPEHQIAVADKRGLLIMMHIAKRDAIADRENLADIQRLCETYPNARWILAHCARSNSSWAIEKAAATLRPLKNVWYDTSSVCESDAMDALYTAVGSDRVMYGSDDIPVGVLRGKYISFGFAWAYLSEKNHALNLSHCEERMTFTRYEQLRAMRRAARRLGMTRAQNDALFHDTALNLVMASGGRAPIS